MGWVCLVISKDSSTSNSAGRHASCLSISAIHIGNERNSASMLCIISWTAPFLECLQTDVHEIVHCHLKQSQHECLTSCISTTVKLNYHNKKTRNESKLHNTHHQENKHQTQQPSRQRPPSTATATTTAAASTRSSIISSSSSSTIRITTFPTNHSLSLFLSSTIRFCQRISSH